jgi:pyrroline-5-carboxylate reductase
MAFDSILIVGCGNMAGAMLDGWLAGGFSPEQFTVADPASRETSAGVRKLDAIPVEGSFDAILLGVKPQLLADVAPQVAGLAGPETVVFSVLAGVELAVLVRHFPRAKARVRVMPNLAAALGKSPIALAADGEPDSDEIIELLSPLGTPEWIEESHFDLITALAGSGPAFVYRFIDALTAAAAELGLPHGEAGRLALAMVEGAAALAASSPHPPAELARRVTSPGGTTQAGLAALDEGDSLGSLLLKTLRAARDRSAELAAEARRKG